MSSCLRELINLINLINFKFISVLQNNSSVVVKQYRSGKFKSHRQQILSNFSQYGHQCAFSYPTKQYIFDRSNCTLHQIKGAVYFWAVVIKFNERVSCLFKIYFNHTSMSI